MGVSRGRRDPGRGTTVAVTGNEVPVDAVDMARWPEEVEEGVETGLSEEEVGRMAQGAGGSPGDGGVCKPSKGRGNGQLSRHH